jgi:hypothetical protein
MHDRARPGTADLIAKTTCGRQSAMIAHCAEGVLVWGTVVSRTRAGRCARRRIHRRNAACASTHDDDCQRRHCDAGGAAVVECGTRSSHVPGARGSTRTRSQTHFSKAIACPTLHCCLPRRCSMRLCRSMQGHRGRHRCRWTTTCFGVPGDQTVVARQSRVLAASHQTTKDSVGRRATTTCRALLHDGGCRGGASRSVMLVVAWVVWRVVVASKY